MAKDIKEAMKARIGAKYSSGKTGASKGAKEVSGMHPGEMLSNALAEKDHSAIVAAVKACHGHGEPDGDE